MNNKRGQHRNGDYFVELEAIAEAGPKCRARGQQGPENGGC
jgi:hypothetical protein